MRKRKRLREINIDELEKIRLFFKFSKKEVADMLDISYTQLNNYYRCGRMGLDKYITITNALRAEIEQEANDKRNHLNNILGTKY